MKPRTKILLIVFGFLLAVVCVIVPLGLLLVAPDRRGSGVAIQAVKDYRPCKEGTATLDDLVGISVVGNQLSGTPTFPDWDAERHGNHWDVRFCWVRSDATSCATWRYWLDNNEVVPLNANAQLFFYTSCP